ncbi:tyrosine-type recombinase/integrase [Komagataeibacter swingsii]|uniref:Tyrosine-type recombinase/integrase n=1 Tax=Komagataeibacter swingsii TaxID=215220 RepID=A0A850P452_9PROT|nr:tyrosine-type recombinase/integrase [Komagataeibacter swingsii]
MQLKTNARVWIPLHEQGKQLLDKMPRHNAEMILTRADGKPWKIDHFRHEMGEQIRAAGLEGIVTHGLRTTAAKWMTAAGCSEREIMAITGHTSSAMVSRYVREASQKRRAQSAATKVPRYRLEQESAKTTCDRPG